MARGVKETTGGGGAAQLLGVWSLLSDDLMTGTPPSRVYLIKAADGFPMGISALGGEEKPVVLILHSPKCVATACPFRPTEAPLTRSKPHNVGHAQLSCSMYHASSSCFDTAIPYVFSVCSAPGDGWNPPVIAMATFRLSSFLCEERCPMERLHWQVA